MVSFVAVGWFPGWVVDFLYVLFLLFFLSSLVHLLKKSFSQCLLVFLSALSTAVTFELVGQF